MSEAAPQPPGDVPPPPSGGSWLHPRPFRIFLIGEAALVVLLAVLTRPWEGRRPLDGLDGASPSPVAVAPGKVLQVPAPLPVAGVVVDDTGAPYAEAQVSLGTCASGGAGATILPLDDVGRFALPTQRWAPADPEEEAPTPDGFDADCLFIRRPGPGAADPVPLKPHRAEDPMRIVIPRPRAVALRVRGPTGATVDAAIAVEQRRGAELAEAQTLATQDGAATILLDPAWPSVLILLSAQGFLDTELSYDLRAPLPTEPVEVSLAAVERTVAVTCHTSGGGPCDRARSRARCDAGGIRGPALPVDEAGLASVVCPQGEAPTVHVWRIDGGGVSAALGPEDRAVEVILPDADGALGGSVRDGRSGVEISTFEVEWRWAPASPPEVIVPGRRSVTDRQGRFDLEGIAPGPWMVGAFADGFGPAAVGPVEVAAGGITLLAPLNLPREAVLEGHVVLQGTTGAPAVHVQALLLGESAVARLLPPADPDAPAPSGPRLAGEAVTDGEGRYRLGALAPGTYRVLAYAFERPPLASATTVEVSVGEGQRRLNVDLTLSSR